MGAACGGWEGRSGTRIPHPGREASALPRQHRPAPGQPSPPHHTRSAPRPAERPHPPAAHQPATPNPRPRREPAVGREAPPNPTRRHSPQRWLSGRRARWREAGQTCYCRTYTSSTDCARRRQNVQADTGPGPRACERRVPARPSGRALRRVRANEAPRRLAPVPRARARRGLSACPASAPLSSACHNARHLLPLIGCQREATRADLRLLRRQRSLGASAPPPKALRPRRVA